MLVDLSAGIAIQQLAAIMKEAKLERELFNAHYKEIQKSYQMSRSGAFVHKAITNTKDKK
jgi:hypothetical protein